MIYGVQVKGYFAVNCYFTVDGNTGHGFLIDPGAQGKELVRLIRSRGWTIEKILLTHGHFDHTGGIEALRREMDTPVYIHKNGKQYLEDPMLNLSRLCGPDIVVRNVEYLQDGDTLALESNPDFTLQVIHTPGHTPDSATFYSETEHAAFVGDTIFKGQPGYDKYPGGDGKALMRSIKEKILTLPEETLLYSGHSEATTVGSEKWRYRI